MIGMRPEPTCPRCASPLRPPGLWSKDWQCQTHGAVLPFRALPRIGAEGLQQTAANAAVPLWVPSPQPSGWLVSGVGAAGHERQGVQATVLALSGPAPLGGPAEFLLVAEEPGVGLGAAYAGLAGPDPGEGFDTSAPHARVEAAGHPTALWSLPTSSACAAFVGEGMGLWLWAVLWPLEAGVLMLEELRLADLREWPALAESLPYGALSPRLVPPRPAA